LKKVIAFQNSKAHVIRELERLTQEGKLEDVFRTALLASVNQSEILKLVSNYIDSNNHKFKIIREGSVIRIIDVKSPSYNTVSHQKISTCLQIDKGEPISILIENENNSSFMVNKFGGQDGHEQHPTADDRCVKRRKTQKPSPTTITHLVRSPSSTDGLSQLASTPVSEFNFDDRSTNGRDTANIFKDSRTNPDNETVINDVNSLSNHFARMFYPVEQLPTNWTFPNSPIPYPIDYRDSYLIGVDFK